MILGANGFVGANVVPELLQRGVEVLALCRDPGVAQRGAVHPGLRWMSFAEASSRPVAGIDGLLSLAGVGTPALFESDPQRMAEAELGIAERIVELAVLHGVRGVQYLSTAGAAYGEGWVAGGDGGRGHGRAFSEGSECRPVSVYGRSKLAAEQHLAALLAERSPASVLSVLRATNIYGLYYAKAGQQGLVNALIERWRQRQSITLYGDGLVYRDYLFASDLAAAHLACLQRPVQGLFNIGAGRSHSILDVVEAVEAVTEHRFERTVLPARGFDVRYLEVSIAKARTVLGWRPDVTLLEGIRRIVGSGTGVPHSS